MEADTPFTISILDGKGRSFQTHLNWLQVRPKEKRTCNGCHSPRRANPINEGGLYARYQNAVTAEAQPTDTMAVVRTNAANNGNTGMGISQLSLEKDIHYVDLWSATPAAETIIGYDDNTNELEAEIRAYAPDAATGDQAMNDLSIGIINFTQHVQAIFNNKCIRCHAADAGGFPINGNLILTD